MEIATYQVKVKMSYQIGRKIVFDASWVWQYFVVNNHLCSPCTVLCANLHMGTLERHKKIKSILRLKYVNFMGWREREWGVTADMVHEFLFGMTEMFWSYIVAMVIQLCEHTKTTQSYTLKAWILWYVAYISIFLKRSLIPKF